MKFFNLISKNDFEQFKLYNFLEGTLYHKLKY